MNLLVPLLLLVPLDPVPLMDNLILTPPEPFAEPTDR
jgi:hypothetical protein